MTHRLHSFLETVKDRSRQGERKKGWKERIMMESGGCYMTNEMTFYLPTQFLVLDNLWRHRSDATKNVWWRDYVKKSIWPKGRCNAEQSKFCFCFYFLCFYFFLFLICLWQHRACTSPAGVRGSCRNYHTISLFSLPQCFSKIHKQQKLTAKFFEPPTWEWVFVYLSFIQV